MPDHGDACRSEAHSSNPGHNAGQRRGVGGNVIADPVVDKQVEVPALFSVTWYWTSVSFLSAPAFEYNPFRRGKPHC